MFVLTFYSCESSFLYLVYARGFIAFLNVDIRARNLSDFNCGIDNGVEIKDLKYVDKYCMLIGLVYLVNSFLNSLQ